jgi:hypothetical protein
MVRVRVIVSFININITIYTAGSSSVLLGPCGACHTWRVILSRVLFEPAIRALPAYTFIVFTAARQL